MKYLLAVILVTAALTVSVSLIRADEARDAQPVVTEPESSIEGLVQVSMRGTHIDTVPFEIFMLVDEPQAQIAAAVKAGAIASPHDPGQVTWKGVRYCFETPAAWNTRAKGVTFRNGDVVYTYLTESAEARTAFLRAYELNKKTGQMVYDDGLATDVFTASPGFYVLVETALESFTCPMHLQIQRDKPGQCPICGMDLIKVTIYR